MAAGHDANRKPGSQAGPSSLNATLIEPDVIVIRLQANHQLVGVVFPTVAYLSIFCKQLVQRFASITSAIKQQ